MTRPRPWGRGLLGAEPGLQSVQQAQQPEIEAERIADRGVLRHEGVAAAALLGALVLRARPRPAASEEPVAVEIPARNP
ncbi:hypothetical protein ABZV91_09565 [Nocardia sp. NPDC004568]|uniref:hypothetical protein n=1 Tax=Nocardia sp. NPDC004568 TaxID=3154551 RepID=UPI00339E53DA